MPRIIDAIQEWLEDQNLEFAAKSETFIIDGDGPKPFKYVPHFTIVGRRFGDKAVIVEPVTSFAPQGGLKRVITFRNQFCSKYHVVVVTRSRMLEQIPESAYDQLVEFEKLSESKIRFR